MDAFKMMKKGTFLNPKVPQTSGPNRTPSILSRVAPLTLLSNRGGANPILEQVTLSRSSAGNISVHLAGLCLPERRSSEWVIPRPLKQR